MPVKILSVDDSRTVRCIVGAALLPYDCILCEAANGAEGLALARREKPDLIVLDVSMPVMDGITMLTYLKEDPELKEIPVLMLTAVSDHNTVVHIARLGAHDYLVKPFHGARLVEKMGRLVSLREKTPHRRRMPDKH
jgi:two-component system cell cycle response regulator